jgi:flagellar biosynthetic protein FliQ
MEAQALDALWMVVWVGAPVLGVVLAVALVVGFFQAATQITEPTLAFVPKLVGVVVVLALLGGWMGDRLVDFAAAQLSEIGERIE